MIVRKMPKETYEIRNPSQLSKKAPMLLYSEILTSDKTQISNLKIVFFMNIEYILYIVSSSLSVIFRRQKGWPLSEFWRQL